MNAWVLFLVAVAVVALVGATFVGAHVSSSFWPWPWSIIMPEPRVVKRQDVFLPDEVRGRHGALFGSPGMGKSKLLTAMMMADVIRRVHGLGERGWCFFDPHGDTSDELISRLALLACKFPKLYELVVVIDPTITDWTVGYNPLEIGRGEEPELKAQNLASTLTTIFKDDPQVVVRLYRVAYYSFLALSLSDRTLLDMPEFLANRAFRETLVQSVPDANVRRFWMREFPQKDGGEATTRVESTMNRIDRIVQSKIAPMLDGASRMHCRELIDKGCFVIVRAPRGMIGTDAAYMLCAFLVSEFEQAALGRANTGKEGNRRPFTLFADEFTEYLTPAIPRIINETRKYRLELFLSTQEVKGHLRTDELMSACVGSVGSIFTLRLGYTDSESLVRELFMPDFDQVKSIEENRITWRGMEEIWQREIRNIMSLPARDLWWKVKGDPTTRRVTTPTIAEVDTLPNAHLIPEARQKLLEAVRAHYGRPPKVTIYHDAPGGDPVEYD